MEGMINRKNRVGRPPLPPQPPRSRAPSALVPPMPSQLGKQPQMMMMPNGGDGMLRPFSEGFGCSINPQNKYQHPENNPISVNPQNQYQHPENNPISSTGLVVSATGTVGSSGVPSESMTVGEARGRQPHPGMDDRKFRRLISNRLSAQKSRLRRTNYIHELENQAKELEVMIATFSPEVIVCHEKKRLLQLENDLMKQKNAMVEEQLNLKNKEADVHQKEIFHLKNLFLIQQQPEEAWMSPSPPGPMDYMTDQDMSQQVWMPPTHNFGISVPVPEEKMTSQQAYQLA